MNLLRQAVGAPELNYIGLSYGTGLGATYANLIPGTVQAVVYAYEHGLVHPRTRP
jgi:pimeloyl-ACP methyl ester carboxylesterase